MKRFISMMTAILMTAFSLFAQNVKARLDSLVSAYANSAEFNGSILVSHKGKIIIAKGYGYMDADQKKPNHAKTVFNIASITKTFTAALILKLQEAGKLNVNDRLSKFEPLFPNGGKITIHHLLTHTSGIPNYTDDKNFQSSDQTKEMSLDKLISFFRNKPLDFEPGAKFRYSNSGYTMLGFIIEKITGKAYGLVLDEMIFTPLKMHNTSFGPPSDSTAPLAQGFQMYYKNYKSPAFKIHPSVSHATGAVYSSVEDLYKWHSALQGNFLSASSLNTVYKKDRGPYGFGWFTDSLYGHQRVSHDGNIPGYKSNINRMPDKNLCVIALSNTNSSAVGGMVRNMINILLDQPLPKGFAQQPVIAVPDSLLKDFTGTYQLYEKDSLGIKVFLSASSLSVGVQDQKPFEIYPVTKNLFKAGDVKIEFRRNGQGRVEFIFIYKGDEFLGARKIH